MESLLDLSWPTWSLKRYAQRRRVHLRCKRPSWTVPLTAGVLAGAVSLALSTHFGPSPVAQVAGAVYLGAALALWGQPAARATSATAAATCKT
jgi:hypothetical protein